MSDPLGGLSEPREPEPARPAAHPRRRRSQPTPTTFALLAVLVIAFIAEGVVGQDSSVQDQVTLFRLGALYAPAVLAGDVWRIGAYAFLHIGWAHLIMNGWALWILMRPIETTYGQAAALGLFAATALAGGFASYEWALLRGHPVLAAGASGGVFGLFGATVALYVRLRHRIPPQALRAALRGLAINLLINAALALTFPVDSAAHVGGFLSGIALGLVAPVLTLDREPWHRPAQWLLTGSAFVLACMEGAAVARAVHPHPRTLSGPGVEARVDGLLVPVEPGDAICPGAMALHVARENEPLRIVDGDDAVRIGDRTFLRERSKLADEPGVERTLLSTADRGGRLVVELQCAAPVCRGDRAEQILLPTARSVHGVP